MSGRPGGVGGYAGVALWAALAAAAAWIALRAHYTADLSAFLPRTPTRAEQVLVDQLRDGLVARTILLDVEGADAGTRTRLSRELAARLRKDPQLRSVLNGESTTGDRDRAFLFERRYLLSDAVTPERFALPGLGTAIGEGLDLLASPAGLVVKDLFVRDPTGELLQILDQLEPAGGGPRSQDGVWVDAGGGRALLVAETRAAGSDTDAAERALGSIRGAFAASRRAVGAEARGAILRLTGPPVFAVEARASIRDAAIRLSILSSLVIAALLLATYRSIRAVLLGLLPVLSGALAGVAAVALGFGVVHGITLGFGVTLIGEAVDYSVYLFVQSQRARQAGAGADTRTWTATLWPTIRLGMLTSVCGFASLLPSAFPGLAQLGLYSIAGLIAAALVTRHVLPALMPADLKLARVEPLGRAVAALLRRVRAARAVLWILPVLAGGVLYGHRGPLWAHDLAVLSPVPVAEQALDGALRADLGAPDVRALLVVTGASREAVLGASEKLGAALDPLVTSGVLAGYQSPSRYLPSLARQQARRASLPDGETLRARLHAALLGLPIQAARLEPFVADVEAARQRGLIEPAEIAGTSLAAGLDALLIERGNEWTALMPLQAARALARPTVGASPPIDPVAPAVDVDRVTRAVTAVAIPDVTATVVDLVRESNALYAGYLGAALQLSALGLAAIVALLLVALRSPGRVARVIAPLGLAVLTVLTLLVLAGQALTLLHLIGLLLIVAVGSNYALFFDQQAGDRQVATPDPETTHRLLASLAIANLSTVIGFGVLAFSGVPVLAALGSTVAPGTFLALVFSAALARR